MDAVEKYAMAPAPAVRKPAFSDEFREVWSQLPNKEVFFALLAAWCLLFQFFGVSSFNFSDTPSLFQWMYGAWSAPALDSGQGKLVPFVVLVLLWMRRKILLASIGRPWWPAIFLVAGALALHVFGFLVQQPRISIIAIFSGLYGLVGLVWGWKTMRASFFPLILFAFCMPLGTFIDPLTLPLRLMHTSITYQICHAGLGIDLLRQGTTLYDSKGTYNYDVAAACSGIRSFFALLGVTIVFSMLALRSFWRRALMIALTIPLVVFCNVVRLSTIILATQAFGNRLGLLVHEWFGFLTYAVALGCLFAAGHWLKEKSPKTTG